jgi:small subunit ribosomal protein S6
MYEGMFLLDSNRFSADPDGAANEVLGILNKAGATVVAHRPWQEGRLAYELDGHRKGLHYLAYFRMDGDGVTNVNRSVHLSETVIRHLLIVQPQSLFDAMVEALNSHDAAQHSAHVGEREERPPRGRRPDRAERSDDVDEVPDLSE